MSTVVVKDTSTNDMGVTYTVKVNGVVKWKKTVLFGRDKAHRAGGRAFQRAAQQQEKEAAKALVEEAVR